MGRLKHYAGTNPPLPTSLPPKASLCHCYTRTLRAAARCATFNMSRRQTPRHVLNSNENLMRRPRGLRWYRRTFYSSCLTAGQARSLSPWCPKGPQSNTDSHPFTNSKENFERLAAKQTRGDLHNATNIGEVGVRVTNASVPFCASVPSKTGKKKQRARRDLNGRPTQTGSLLLHFLNCPLGSKRRVPPAPPSGKR